MGSVVTDAIFTGLGIGCALAWGLYFFGGMAGMYRGLSSKKVSG